MEPGSQREVTTSVNPFAQDVKLADRYRLIEEIGAGGMGVVFRAEDEHLGRSVAIKVLPASLCAEANALGRFRNEARVLSQLNHPGICTIHDLAEHEGRPFLVMELLRGRTLEAAIDGSPMAAEAVIEIACQVAAGLEAAHAAQIIHRDLKPGNILLTEGEAVKILDFGVAKLAGEVTIGPDVATQVQAASALTQAGALIGTPRYMSPEQTLGDELDPRTDLFSFGAVLYEMTTGRPPFLGSSVAEVREAVLHHQPQPPSQVNTSVPPALDTIIGKLLEKDRDRRYQSVSQLRADLRDAGFATTCGSDLEAAREAHTCGDWRRAFSLFCAADRDVLTAQDLERLSDSAFWLSEYAVHVDALERAHTRYVQDGEHAEAARTAAHLACDHIAGNRRTVARGWLRRAERLLSDVPECAAHGYVTRCACRMAIEVDQDFERALRLAEETLAIADRCADPDLHAFAVQDRGRCLVMLGDVEHGMEQLDEAMVDAMAGALSPVTVGATYCNMIDTCERLGDYRRAGEWCDHASGWCESRAQSVFPGVCNVHHAEVMRMRGEWQAAEEEAKGLIEEHRGKVVFVAALASNVVGNIELRRGRLDAAEAAFRETLALEGDPMPGLALLRIEQGRVDDAESLVTRALEERPSVLDRARLLATSVEVALAAGRVPAALERLEELESVAEQCQSPTFRCSTVMLRGAVALANGQAEEAIGLLRQAVETWRSLGMPWETAQSRHLLSRGYREAGDSDLADLESGAAKAVFDRLGAVPPRG
jgi:tetratricopeptide (TPR) repeat protein